jgi:hypothetical protein
MPPPAISPDQILDYAPRNKARIVEIDANVAAYFGDLFRDMREGLKGSAAAGKKPQLMVAAGKKQSKHPSRR